MGKYNWREYNGIDKLFGKVYKDFKDKIRLKKINNNNISQITRNYIGEIYKPQDIISYPKKMCGHITLIYQLVARSISSNEKGSTFLSSAFLKIISNIFGIKDITIEECKRIIKSLGFKIDNKNRIEKKILVVGLSQDFIMDIKLLPKKKLIS